MIEETEVPSKVEDSKDFQTLNPDLDCRNDDSIEKSEDHVAAINVDAAVAVESSQVPSEAPSNIETALNGLNDGGFVKAGDIDCSIPSDDKNKCIVDTSQGDTGMVIDIAPDISDRADGTSIGADEQEDTTEPAISRCICSSLDELGFMICCETCGIWQHGECVGIDKSNVPELYFCEQCRDPIVKCSCGDESKASVMLQCYRCKNYQHEECQKDLKIQTFLCTFCVRPARHSRKRALYLKMCEDEGVTAGDEIDDLSSSHSDIEDDVRPRKRSKSNSSRSRKDGSNASKTSEKKPLNQSSKPATKKRPMPSESEYSTRPSPTENDDNIEFNGKSFNEMSREEKKIALAMRSFQKLEEREERKKKIKEQKNRELEGMSVIPLSVPSPVKKPKVESTSKPRNKKVTVETHQERNLTTPAKPPRSSIDVASVNIPAPSSSPVLSAGGKKAWLLKDFKNERYLEATLIEQCVESPTTFPIKKKMLSSFLAETTGRTECAIAMEPLSSGLPLLQNRDRSQSDISSGVILVPHATSNIPQQHVPVLPFIACPSPVSASVPSLLNSSIDMDNNARALERRAKLMGTVAPVMPAHCHLSSIGHASQTIDEFPRVPTTGSIVSSVSLASSSASSLPAGMHCDGHTMEPSLKFSDRSRDCDRSRHDRGDYDRDLSRSGSYGSHSDRYDGRPRDREWDGRNGDRDNNREFDDRRRFDSRDRPRDWGSSSRDNNYAYTSHNNFPGSRGGHGDRAGESRWDNSGRGYNGGNVNSQRRQEWRGGPGGGSGYHQTQSHWNGSPRPNDPPVNNPNN